MNVVALIPGIIAFWYGMKHSAAEAFLKVYLPTMLLIPDYFRFVAPGAPDPTFSSAGILGVTFAALARGEFRARFSALDGLVLGYVVCVFFSEYNAMGYSAAQNLAFDVGCRAFLPYWAAKNFLELPGFRRRAVFIMVACFLVVSVVGLYEFRFIVAPFKMPFQPFFPGVGLGWVTNIRWGFGRVAGPYGHAILNGIMMGGGVILAVWLVRTRFWKERLHQAGVLGTLAVGLVISLSRGPWIGTFFGLTTSFLAAHKKRTALVKVVLPLAIIIGVPTFAAFKAYVSVGREGATNATQETAAYRFELMEKYWSIALEHMWFGWGLNTWPKVPGMPSIDNHYLLLLMRHGLTTVFCFLGVMLWTAVRLGWRLSKLPPESDETLFHATLLGIIAHIGFTLTTVYLGLQTVQLLFITAAWAEANLLRDPRTLTSDAGSPLPVPQPTFRRVIA